MSENPNFVLSEQPSTPGMALKFTLLPRSEVELQRRVLIACIEIQREHIRRHKETLDWLESLVAEENAREFAEQCLN